MGNKIIYHEIYPGVPCIDGAVAAWAASRHVLNAELIGCTYQCAEEDLPRVEPGDSLYIVDFSFPQDVVSRWLAMDCSITVLDHHKSAMANKMGLTPMLTEVFDMGKCGAVLTWEFFSKEPPPAFLKYVQDRDLFTSLYQLTGAYRIFAEEILTLPLEEAFKLFDEQLEMTEEELDSSLQEMSKHAKGIRESKILEMAARVRFGTVGGFGNIPYVPLLKEHVYLRSDICKALYQCYPDKPFSACLLPNGTWELRSDRNGSNFDVGALAKKFGGGGHRNAAGYKSTITEEE